MADKGESIWFVTLQPQLIRTPFNGYLTEIVRNGRPTGLLGRTGRLTPRNKNKAVVNVYSYDGPVLPMPPVPPRPPMPPPGGTYVVLEFAQSEKFFYGRPPQTELVKLREGGFDPEDAEHIRSSADPRVFLMKPVMPGHDSTGVVFAWHGSTQHVITVFPDPQEPAKLLPRMEGNEGQVFQLFPTINRSDMQEIQPHELATPGE